MTNDDKKRTDSYWLPDDPPKVIIPREIDWARVFAANLGRALYLAGWEAIERTPHTDNLVIALLEIIKEMER